MNESVLCPICNNILRDPVFLPCQNTVCSYHTEVCRLCYLCQKTHERPVEHLDLDNVEEDAIKPYFYASEYEKLTKVNLEKAYIELDYLLKKNTQKEIELDLFFAEHFVNIKHQINEKRKDLSLEVEKISERMLHQVTEYERLFKEKLACIKTDYRLIAEPDLSKLKASLENNLVSTDLNKNEFATVRQDMMKVIRELNEKMHEMDKTKLNVKECFFKANNLRIQDALFGELALAFDHQLISCSIDSTIKIWDINKGEVIKTLTGHTGNTLNLTISHM